jgi:hypothetical protein
MSDIAADLGEPVNAEVTGGTKAKQVMRVYLSGNMLVLILSTDKGEKVEVYRRVKK